MSDGSGGVGETSETSWVSDGSGGWVRHHGSLMGVGGWVRHHGSLMGVGGWVRHHGSLMGVVGG